MENNTLSIVVTAVVIGCVVGAIFGFFVGAGVNKSLPYEEYKWQVSMCEDNDGIHTLISEGVFNHSVVCGNGAIFRYGSRIE